MVKGAQEVLRPTSTAGRVLRQLPKPAACLTTVTTKCEHLVFLASSENRRVQKGPRAQAPGVKAIREVVHSLTYAGTDCVPAKLFVLNIKLD